MALTFYSIPVSSYCARVRLFLWMRGISHDEVPPPGGTYASDAYRAVVRQGSVPAIDHDGFILADSEAIVEYLDEISPGPKLISSDARTRAGQRALARFHDTRVESAVRALFPLVTGARPRQDLPALIALLDESLKRLAAIASPSPFLAGAAPGHADLAFPTTLMMGSRLAEVLGASMREPASVTALRQAYDADPLIRKNTGICSVALEAWISEKMR